MAQAANTVMENKVALVLWVKDRPVKGSTIVVGDILSPKREPNEFKEGDRVIARCRGYSGKHDALIVKLGGIEKRREFDLMLGAELDDLVKTFGLDETDPKPATPNKLVSNSTKPDRVTPKVSEPAKPSTVKKRKGGRNQDFSKRLENAAEQLDLTQLNHSVNSAFQTPAKQAKVNEEMQLTSPEVPNIPVPEMPQVPEMPTSPKVPEKPSSCSKCQSLERRLEEVERDLIVHRGWINYLYDCQFWGNRSNSQSFVGSLLSQQDEFYDSQSMGNNSQPSTNYENKQSQPLMGNTYNQSQQSIATTSNQSQPLMGNTYNQSQQSIATTSNQSLPPIANTSNQNQPSIINTNNQSQPSMASIHSQQDQNPMDSQPPATIFISSSNDGSIQDQGQELNQSTYCGFTKDQLRHAIKKKGDYSKTSKTLFKMLYKVEEYSGRSLTGNTPNKMYQAKPQLDHLERLDVIYELVKEKFPATTTAQIREKLREVLKPSVSKR